jgi:SH3 domain protein
MKSIVGYAVFIHFIIIISTLSAQAESMYVTDVLKVTLRTGPSTDNKIIKMVESGQKIELIEPGQEWSLVRLNDGKEGWILNRYMISDETSKIKLVKLESKHSTLKAKFNSIFEENSELKTENKKLGSELSDTKKELERIRNDYESLKANSAEFLTLQANFEKVSNQLSEQTQKANELEKQVSNLEVSYYIKWFMAGSGVLFVGFVLGFSTKRKRRQPSLI